MQTAPVKFDDYEKELVLKTAHQQGAEGLYKLAKELKIELNKDGHCQICELCQEKEKNISRTNKNDFIHNHECSRKNSQIRCKKYH